MESKEKEKYRKIMKECQAEAREILKKKIGAEHVTEREVVILSIRLALYRVGLR